MTQITHLIKNYSNDLKNFLNWFDYDIQEKQKLNLPVFFLNKLLYTMRETQGLEENTDFINDIHNSKNLSMSHIDLYCVNPGKRTTPIIFKIRRTVFRKGIDKLFDDSIPDRNCILCIPSTNNACIEYIDKTELVSDGNLGHNFKIGSTIAIGNQPFIMPVDTPFYFNNNNGTEPLFMLHVAFACNPPIGDVIDQLL